MPAKQSYEDLLKALRTIRDECEFRRGSCSGCPLATGPYECGVTHQTTCGDYDYRIMPRFWNVQSPALLRKKED